MTKRLIAGAVGVVIIVAGGVASASTVGEILLSNGYQIAESASAGPESWIDCTLYDGSFEYYFEVCHDDDHMWSVNGACNNGVKEEMSEIHACGGSKCYVCPSSDGTPWKTLCGADQDSEEDACAIAIGGEAPEEGCGEEKIAAYFHQCNSDKTSYYNREDILCDGANKPSVTDNFKTVRCGTEWYYPFPNGNEVVFDTSNKYCLDCGESIGVCADDPDKSCMGLGLPPPGRKITTAPPPGFDATEVDDHAHGHEHEDGDDHEHFSGTTEVPTGHSEWGGHTHGDGGHSHEGIEHSNGSATDAPTVVAEEGEHTHGDGDHSHEGIDHSHGATDAPTVVAEEEDHTQEYGDNSHEGIEHSYGSAPDAQTDLSDEGDRTNEDGGHSHEGIEHSHSPIEQSESEVESSQPPSEGNVASITQDSAAVLARGMLCATIIAWCFVASAPLAI